MAGYQLHYITPKVIEEPRGPQQYLLSQLYSGLWWKIRLIYYPQQLAAPFRKQSGHKLCRALDVTEKIKKVFHPWAGKNIYNNTFGNVRLSSNFIPPPLVLPQRPKRELAEHGSAYMPRQRYRSKPTARTHTTIYTRISMYILVRTQLYTLI